LERFSLLDGMVRYLEVWILGCKNEVCLQFELGAL
jgi:hypothetical protein